MLKFPQKSAGGKTLKFLRDNFLIAENEKIIVALSGGPDSMALVNILIDLKDELKIQVSACHFNHHLRGEESDKDEEFVFKFCKEKGIECITGEASNKVAIKSEEKAREARYSFFEKLLGDKRGDKIAIAHNKNDVVETLIFNIVRGSGIRGIRSIPSRRENFIRPLLVLSRDEIVQYLKLHHIPYQIDRTNFDIRFSRNYIRHKIVPELAKLNPKVIDALAETSKQAETDYDFIENEARLASKKIVKYDGKNDSLYFSRQDFLLLHPALRHLVLRNSIEKLASLSDITSTQIKEVLEVIEKGIGKKHKTLPHSLRVDLQDGKITIVLLRK